MSIHPTELVMQARVPGVQRYGVSHLLCGVPELPLLIECACQFFMAFLITWGNRSSLLQERHSIAPVLLGNQQGAVVQQRLFARVRVLGLPQDGIPYALTAPAVRFCAS